MITNAELWDLIKRDAQACEEISTGTGVPLDMSEMLMRAERLHNNLRTYSGIGPPAAAPALSAELVDQLQSLVWWCQTVHRAAPNNSLPYELALAIHNMSKAYGLVQSPVMSLQPSP